MEIIYGLFMAVADSVPGVSGGTIAFLMGFYDDFIGSLRNAAARDIADRKKAWRFLALLLVGWCGGMALATMLLASLFESHIYQVSSAFMGFILASIPVVIWREREGLLKQIKALPMVLVGFAIVFLVVYFSTHSTFELSLTRMTFVNGPILFVAAAVAAAAMILPGISGSSLMMAFGLYIPFMSQLNELLHGNFSALPTVLIYVCGAITGILCFIRLIKMVLARYRAQTIYVVIGMMLASLYGVIQGPTTLDVPVEALSFGNCSVIFFIVGCAFIGLITLFERRKSIKAVTVNK